MDSAFFMLLFALGGLSLSSAARAEVPEQFRVRGAEAGPAPHLADAGVGSPRSVEARATGEEKTRGFIAFSKPPTAVVSPDYVPSPAERCAALEARDCPGQYGPITFTIFALADGEFSVNVTDLAGPAGRVIGAENLDVRVVRYVRVQAGGKPDVIPLLIEAFRTKKVFAGRGQQFWITYYIPPDAVPGLYEGQARVLVDGVSKLSLPLRVRVNPFALVEADADFYMYYGTPTEPSELGALRAWLMDQRCHGMTVGMVDAPVTREGDVSREAMARVLDAYKSAGFARPSVRVDLWNRITSEWLNTPDEAIGMWGPWFRYYPFSTALDERYVRTVRMIADEAKARGLQLILAVADEPGSHAWTIEAARHYNALVKEQVPDVVRELTCGGGWAMGQPEHELWKELINIWTTNRWLPDKLDIVRRDDPEARIALYNMAGAGSAAGGLTSARAVFGFFPWKARAGGVAQWVYWHSGTPEHNYAWPARDLSEGAVPTLRWEAVREGTKDCRYLATLEQLMAGRQDAPAEAARRLLGELAAQVELRTEDYDPAGGGRVPAGSPGTYDEWRAQIADLIEKLAPEAR